MDTAQRGKVFDDLRSFMARADELAAELLEMGIESMKIWPFDFAEGAVDGGDISTEDLRRAMLPFQKVRKAHGDRMRLKAELHRDLGADRRQKDLRRIGGDRPGLGRGSNLDGPDQ